MTRNMCGLRANPIRQSVSCLGYIAVLLFTLTATAFGQGLVPSQVIPLRSESALARGSDTHVVTMANQAPAGGASAKPQAQAPLAKGLAGVLANIESDPTAQWIKPTSDSSTAGSLAGYTIPFTVNSGAIASADMQYTAGFAGELAYGETGSLKLNGTLIGYVDPVTSGALHNSITIDDLGPLLHEGINWLEVSDLPMGTQSQLVLTAKVNIWRTPDIPAQRVAHRKDLALEKSNYAMSGINACRGFTCRPRGDLDSDFDIDLTDYFLMVDCFSGAGLSAAENCEYADMDCDGDVDLVDMAIFHIAFTGTP